MSILLMRKYPAIFMLTTVGILSNQVEVAYAELTMTHFETLSIPRVTTLSEVDDRNSVELVHRAFRRKCFDVLQAEDNLSFSKDIGKSSDAYNRLCEAKLILTNPVLRRKYIQKLLKEKRIETFRRIGERLGEFDSLDFIINSLLLLATLISLLVDFSFPVFLFLGIIAAISITIQVFYAPNNKEDECDHEDILQPLLHIIL